MDTTRFDAILASTLADRRLSRGERQTLQQLLDETAPDDRTLTALRSRVFDLARRELITDDAKQVLDWAEDVLKLLTAPAAGPAGAIHSEAYFSPHDDCVGRIVRLFADNPGAGALAHRGQMVDKPHLARAERTLARAKGR